MGSETQQPQQTGITVKNLFGRDEVKKKFQELLGKRSPSFITSVLQAVSSNALLSKADPHTVYHAAAVAATLDLPIHNALGFAYIIPYNQKQPDNTYKQVAQFQIGYKGYIQLAQRSGQIKSIGITVVYEGQRVASDPLFGDTFDWNAKKSDTIIGYLAGFKQINGFEKTWFWTTEEVRAHGLKYSQSYKKGYGLWKDDFDAMAKKTVLKALLSLYAPLSVEMQQAMVVDQAVINDEEGTVVTYVDNEPVEVVLLDKVAERWALLIEDATTVDQLDKLYEDMPAEYEGEFQKKRETLKQKSK